MCFLWYFQEYKQTSENIFRKFFWNAPKHMKTFSFPENSISGKYLFSGNAFTRTKRSLNVKVSWNNTVRFMNSTKNAVVPINSTKNKLDITYFVEIEHLLLKVLYIKVKVSWNSTMRPINSTKNKLNSEIIYNFITLQMHT